MIRPVGGNYYGVGQLWLHTWQHEQKKQREEEQKAEKQKAEVLHEEKSTSPWWNIKIPSIPAPPPPQTSQASNEAPPPNGAPPSEAKKSSVFAITGIVGSVVILGAIAAAFILKKRRQASFSSNPKATGTGTELVPFSSDFESFNTRNYTLSLPCMLWACAHEGPCPTIERCTGVCVTNNARCHLPTEHEGLHACVIRWMHK